MISSPTSARHGRFPRIQLKKFKNPPAVAGVGSLELTDVKSAKDEVRERNDEEQRGTFPRVQHLIQRRREKFDCPDDGDEHQSCCQSELKTIKERFHKRISSK